jgi:hypothetical protein
MLNPFPIQFLAPLAYTLLRIVLGYACIHIANRMWQSSSSSYRRALSGFLLVFGGLLCIGFATQIAALAVLVLTSLATLSRKILPDTPRLTLGLMATMALSLFITGAGLFAFDLPL